MRQKLTLILLLALFSFSVNAQDKLYTLDFESAGGYTTSVVEFTDGGGDYFLRTNGSDFGTYIEYLSPVGTYFFAGMDLDGEGASLPLFLDIDDIDISNYTSLEFRIYLAEDDDGSNEDWDATDYLHIDFDIDNSGSFSNLLWIESSGATNTAPLIDTDFDGTGDGTEITSTFAQFTQAIAGTGSLLDLKLTFNLNSGDEDIAIDHIEIYGMPDSPNDATSYATGSGVSQPPAANISSLFDTQGELFEVFIFKIHDQGGTDGLPTEVTEITIKAGPNNTADWANDIGGGVLFKQGFGFLTVTIDPTVTADQVTFYIDDGELDVPDGAAETISLYVWYNTTTTDNAVTQCMIDADNHGFRADFVNGSYFASDFNTDIIGNEMTTDVVATEFNFLVDPSDVFVGQVMSPAVSVGLTDENGNLDVDYAPTDVSLAFSGSGTMGGTTTVQSLMGVSAFADLTFDQVNTDEYLTASGTFADVQSALFSVSNINTTTIPYTEDFATDLGQTSQYNVSGPTKEWIHSVNEGGVAYMSGYNSGDLEEDWLIFPSINFDNYSLEELTFSTWYQYGTDDVDNYLKLYYSTDYAGFGDPTAATWTELSFTQPGAATTWTPSGAIDLSAINGTNVHIAFKYNYASTMYRNWYVDNINILENVAVGGATCAEAAVILAGTHHALHSVDDDYDQWYTFVATVNGIATVENCASDVDMYWTIDETSCGNNILSGDEDVCGASGYSEDFDFPITAGETYFIGLANWDQSIFPEYDWTLTETEVAFQVSTIAELRAGTIGNLYELTGEAVLTFQQDFRGQKFIQDATAGILIDDDATTITTVYDIYDGITGITGTLGEYGGMMQFVPSADPGAASTTGNTVTPEVVDLATFATNFEDYESELITINACTFTDGGTPFANGTAYEITDGSKGTGSFRTTFYDMDYIGTDIPTAEVNITGLPNSRSDGGEHITSRDLADIEVVVDNFSVTFNVDMTDSIASGFFVEGVDQLFIGTDINAWATPGDDAAFEMFESGTNDIYTLTMNLDDGDYLYKYAKVVGGVPTWDYAEWIGDPNRMFTMAGADLVLDDVFGDMPINIEVLTSNGISIYPNPSTGLFNISVENNFNLEVIDITGKVLNSEKLSGDSIIEINTSGVYFLRFFNEKGSVIEKVIVQ